MHHPWQLQAPHQVHVLETIYNNGFFLPNPEETVVVWLLFHKVIALKVLWPLTANAEKPTRATIFCGFPQHHPIYFQFKHNVFMLPFSLTLHVSLSTLLLLLTLFFYTALLMQYLFSRTSCDIFYIMHTLKIITHEHLLKHRTHFKHTLSTHCLSVITNGYMLVTEKRDCVWAEYLSKLTSQLPLPRDKIRHTLRM